MQLIVFEGKKEATQHDSHENFLVDLRDRSFICSREGETYIQHVRQPAAEARSEMAVPDANTVDGA